MIRVNLLATTPGTAPQRDWLPREQRSAVVGLALLVVTAVGVGGWWWYLQRERSSVEVKIQTANAELERLKSVATLVERATARRTELSERLALIERLRATMRGPVSLLETVSRSLPDGLWLIEIKQAGTGVQIEGRATSLTSVTDFTELIQNSGLFQKPVEIVTTTTEQVEETSIVRFVVKAEALPAIVPPATAGASGTKTPPVPAPAPATSASGAGE